MRRPNTLLTGLSAGSLAAALLAGTAALPASAAPQDPGAGPSRSPELSEGDRLADRRGVVVGERFYAMGTEDGLYPAMGWHNRGEMGGFWSPPIKLLDGLWFGVDGQWLGADVAARRFTSGWGYTRVAYRPAGGVEVRRTDVALDELRAGLVGLTFSSAAPRTVRLALEAHSELMTGYPWGWTTPNQLEFNLADTGSYAGSAGHGALLFHEQGTPPVPNAEPHDFAALVGSTLRPAGHELGPDFRGPQDPAVVCPVDGDQPDRCDDSAAGKGTGGRLTYQLELTDRPTTVWFAVAGSDHGAGEARAALTRTLAEPERLAGAKIARRESIASRTVVDLPGDPLLEGSVAWSKQNLADSVQQARDLELRATHEGHDYPVPAGTLDAARWVGAGWPDYPWLFAVDGEYTAFASVAAGQFAPIKDHLRAVRDVSEIVNGGSGKVVHEITPDGAVYFGANDDPGNTDETAKFPSAVALVWRWTGDDGFRDEMYDFAVRGMRHVVQRLDADGDGWPEGLANVERQGMGAEKLDSTVYTIRGLYDLADMARSRGDGATAAWADEHAEAMASRFEQAWWFGGDTDSYADSLDDPGDPANDNTAIFQRHWIGVTPMEALLTRDGEPQGPLAGREHGRLALDEREQSCYTDEFGLYHTGTGPTSAESGNPGPSCDSVLSAVPGERVIFPLGTSIMAAAEGNFGRLGEAQQQRYSTANARVQLDPRVWEMPGAMPEISPSPGFGANIERRFTDRAMVLQAWGAYGVLWPVVHHQLGISPDLGQGRLSVVPQIPEGQVTVAGRNVRLGAGAVDVRAFQSGRTLGTLVTRHLNVRLTLGHVLPGGAEVSSVSLNGQQVDYTIRETARGREVVADAGAGKGQSTLLVRLR
ncbi:MAG: hypothetical protein ACRDPT_14300 [Streptomycetales bacterium]